MPRGRHRHSPPLHRLLPPSAIAGVSAVCALGPWVFSEPWVLRGLAAAAAMTAVVGAVVMRHWDTQAGKRVADLTRARASDEWRFEERVAELETDLEESRELRGKLEQRLRAKRAELAGLRNEHAALLRRYATAETERASALEGRRLLEIEAVAPARALPPAPVAAETVVEPVAEPEAGAVAAPVAGSGTESAETVTPAVFSPEGSSLFLRARAALAKLDTEKASTADGEPEGDGRGKAEAPVESDGLVKAEAPVAFGGPVKAEALAGPSDDPAKPNTDAPAKAEVPAPYGGPGKAEAPAGPFGGPAKPNTDAPAKAEAPAAPSGGPAKPHPAAPVKESGDAQAEVPAQSGSPSNDRAAQTGSLPQEDEAQGKPEAADGQEHTRAAAVTPGKPALPAQQPAGHFVAPTAVAVVPSAPVRHPRVEGGFDFFGTHKGEATPGLEDVQNEDLADVVGQEALALHKAESEAQFKPADEESRGVGQVIDLTAHDETEQIDVQGLRSAAS
ncbi:hypothetical protein [Streptomyces sp. NPDC002779]|uniref:hypothetical protein n=1 Tax=Streptomyces sp. NPDC002779 TaxID=3364664 RepID=UPI0036897242